VAWVTVCQCQVELTTATADLNLPCGGGCGYPAPPRRSRSVIPAPRRAVRWSPGRYTRHRLRL